ncbi:MAG: hypothetical protein KC547_09855 [Anaerolineae bacterium]|nr:hypothetical protein [Anaerolineae bacterium]
MRILLDECVPNPLKRLLGDYDVLTMRQMGWNGLKNGELLRRLVEEKFDVLLTVDQNIEYQQNVAELPLAIIIMIAQNNRLEALEPLIPQVVEVLETIRPGIVQRVGVMGN